jgi:diguanylate cyclase (GGDEF)-like protein
MVERSSTDGDTMRLQALHSLKIFDTQSEARFDRVTRMARRLFNVPLAVLRLTDRRDAVPGEHGDVIAALEAMRAPHSRDVVIVPDVLADSRLRGDARLAGTAPVVEGIAVRFFAGYPVCAPDGSRLGTLCLIDRVPRTLSAEDKELLNELGAMIDEALRSWSMATSDALTKLANRRGFECIASHLLPIAKRLRLALSLVQIDLDGFKEINDSQGHEAGDRLLVTFAKHLLKNFRQSDVVARLGGDEFCVLMSGTVEEQVRQSLHRLKCRLETVGGGAIRFSAGIATFNAHRHSAIEDLLREADQRMYEIKRRKHSPAPEAFEALPAPSIGTA